MLNKIYKIFNHLSSLKIKTGIKIFFLVIFNNYSKYPKYVLNFENTVAKKFNSKFSLTFSSGTAAFHSSLFSLGLKKKSLVFISRLTFPSTVISLLKANYQVKYLDYDTNFNPILPAKYEKLTPDLIVVTHPFGIPIKNTFIDKIKEKNKNLKIIFDCSHTQGVKIDNKYLNEYADISFFSIQGSKAISGGEGGLILTNSEQYYNRMIDLSHPGRNNNDVINSFAGLSIDTKFRMHPLAAIIAQSNLKNLENKNFDISKKFKNIYTLLDNNDLIKIPKVNYSELGGFHLGLPFFIMDKTEKIQNNKYIPILDYNWPNYEKNEFYNPDNFSSKDFETLQKEYLDIKKFDKDEYDLSLKLFFINLNWIKSNSNQYIIKNVKNLLNSI